MSNSCSRREVERENGKKKNRNQNYTFQMVSQSTTIWKTDGHPLRSDPG